MMPISCIIRRVSRNTKRVHSMDKEWISRMTPDKNLINTVKDLEVEAPTSHEANQLQQDKMDRRKEMLRRDKGYKENEQSSYE